VVVDGVEGSREVEEDEDAEVAGAWGEEEEAISD